jgi:hypothetical protein
MALINLQSDLKKLTFGEFGVQEPLVTKPIDGSASTSGIELEGSKRVDDLKRITKLLTQTPTSLKFAANLTALNKIQNDIQSPDKSFVGNALRGARDSAKIIASTLAQVPVSGTGTHFVTGFAGKKGYLEGVRGHLDYKNSVPNALYESGSNNITTIGKIEESGNTNKRGKILSTYVNKFEQNLDDNSLPFSPDTRISTSKTLEELYTTEQRNKLNKGENYKLLYVPQGRKKNPTKAFDRQDQGFETQVKVSTDNSGSVVSIVTDLLTGMRPMTGSVEDPSSKFTLIDAEGKALNDYKDLIDFNFKIIEPIKNEGDSPTITYIPFRAYLDSFNDDFSSNWDAFKYIGRAEDFYTYGGFNRSINFSFKVAASSKAEMTPLYEKLNILAGSTAPSYAGTGFMRGQFVAITIGDYLQNQTGYIQSIGFSWSTDYIWHSEGMNEFGEGESSSATAGQAKPKAKNLPTILDVNVAFVPIHTENPKFGSEFIGKTNNIFVTNN